MINLLLGAPGGGKSYEAVAYHVLPALNNGRKVITNLPLVLDQFPPEQRALLEIRDKAKGRAERKSGLAAALGEGDDDEVFTRPFSTVECYGDPWRHPEHGSGPLYVIDEAHMCLPRENTGRKVREWYAMHRHEFADVLLITQSYGKVAKDIVDLVQVCYKVRKATAFGTNNGYIRKVFDGVRGDCVNTGARKYDPKFFKFYRSHTKSSSAGQELAANDIVPLWKRWPFIGLGICTVIFIGILSSGAQLNPMKPPPPKSVPSRVVAPAPPSVPPVSVNTATPKPVPEAARTEEHSAGNPAQVSTGRHAQSKGHPFAGMGIHVVGYAQMGAKRFYSVVFSQNGQRMFFSTSLELAEAGYKVRRISDCAMGLTYEDLDIVAVCDAPQVGVSPGEGVITEKAKPSEGVKDAV